MARPAAVPALLAALLAAQPAAALTCAPPDPIRSFGLAQEAPESYVVLHGRLTLPGGPWPTLTDGPPGDLAPDTILPPVEARFDGFALGLAGFTHPFEETLLLDPICLGPWCGSIGPGTWLLFARQDGGAWRVAVEPCGAWAFDRVQQATLDRLAACIRGEPCDD